MVLDSTPCQLFDYIVIGENEIFSPNSARVAYVAKEGDKQFVVVDDRTESPFDGIGGRSVSFSLDSKRIAYIARMADKKFVVYDGVEKTRYNNVWCPVFSDDSAHLAYVAQLDRGHGIIIDESLVYQCDGVVLIGGGSLLFGANSRLNAVALIGGGLYSLEMKL
jgi:hypothetical protein